jgi:putative transposase
MKYQFIAEECDRYRVGSLCRTLGVSRSGFYSWRQKAPSAREKANVELEARIRAIHRQSDQIYGSPRVYSTLRQEGVACSRNRVARLMQRHDIRAKTKRRFKVTTQSRHKLPIARDLVVRRFEAPSPNKVWTSDITYLWTREGWAYLAVVLDLYSRMIVGWELSDRLTAELVTSAVARALDQRTITPGPILHSDRGSQYASLEVQHLAQGHGIRLSMGATGSCYDNAVTESFFHTLKTELTYFRHYDTRQEARQSIFHYIEVFYNRQRLHSTVGNISPWIFEQQHKTP